LPFPSNLVPQGFIVYNAQEVIPQLTVNYLLFDFGGRAAAVEAAGQISIAGNVAFTAAHQQLIFNVARAYFTAAGADAAVRAARQGLADAQVVQQSAEALFVRGLDTVVDVQLARRGTAQAQYDLAQANTAQHDAMYTLLAAMELPPTTKLRVADVSERPLPQRTARTVDDVLSNALRQRPDLLAGVAKLRATDAEIAATRSKLSVGANVQGNISRLNVDNSPYFGVAKPQGAALLKFEWPLYEGGLLQNKLGLAQSKREEAAAALKERTDQALREVALAYDQVDTGLQQYDAAMALQTASEAAFHSASDSYAHGVGTFTDATSAQTGLATARAAVARAHVFDADGNLWSGQNWLPGSQSGVNKSTGGGVIKFSPNGTALSPPITGFTGMGIDGVGWGTAVTKDRVWISSFNGKILVMDFNGKPVATEADFPFKEKLLGLMGIGVAPNGDVWITDGSDNQLLYFRMEGSKKARL
jgi:outer membrane protein TolC